MKALRIQRAVDLLLALVWLFMGLYCKVLGLVPRHESIVGAILGPEHAGVLTVLIGLGECLLAIWIFSGYWRKVSALLQISLVLLMNALEFSLAQDLLLWGPLNLLFALAFCFLVYWNAYRLGPPAHAAPNETTPLPRRGPF